MSSLVSAEPNSALAAFKPGITNSPPSLTEPLELLEAAWSEFDPHDQVGEGDSVDHESLVDLCKQNLVFACGRYYHLQKSRYFEALKQARALAPGPLRDRELSALKKVRTRMDRFAKVHCLAGNAFGCQDILEQAGNIDLMNVVKSYCLGGGIEYCMTVGFALLNRWTRGQKELAPAKVMPSAQEVVLDEAKTFMAKGCQAGSLEACSELIQGPLAELSDPRTVMALEYFDRLCGEGDPAACVSVSGALYSGDRHEIADAVKEYCELRSRANKPSLNAEEREVCSRLARDEAVVDDVLWRQMLGLMYEGPRLSAKVLEHLAPERSVAAP